MGIKNKIAIVTAIGLSAISVNALYASPSTYIEANGGYVHTDNNSINSISSESKSNFGFNFNAGVGGILEYTSFEFGYSYLGSPTYNGSSTALNNFDFATVLHIPIIQRLSLLAKAGIGLTTMGSSTYTDSETKFGYLFGAGARYALNNSFYIQGLYQFYGNNGNIPNANMVMAGIGFVF